MSIEDFLYFVKNCTLMVTDSFHGTCFSIIFNRPFYCIYNKERGASRIDTLKELFEIDTSRFTCYADLGQLNFTMEEMDYKQVNEKIIEERNRGQQWILNSLKLPGKKCFKWCIADRAEVLIIHLMNRIVGKLKKKKEKTLQTRLNHMKKYITVHYDKCTGCEACMNICGANAISMEVHENGFYIQM